MMNNKKFFLIFSILTFIIWSGSWWMYYAFMKTVHASSWSEAKLIKIISESCLVLAFLYIAIQTVVLKKKGAKFLTIAGKVILTSLGLYFVYILAQKNPNAEGLDIIFTFILALLSAFLSDKFNFKISFGSLLLVWFFILFINEMGVQRAFLSHIRSGTMIDIRNNMAGILIGLAISMRWFWRK